MHELVIEAKLENMNIIQDFIGELGLFIVKNIMDSVTYNRDGNKNILAIREKLEV